VDGTEEVRRRGPFYHPQKRIELRLGL
jgi:hypothetical protein